MKKFLKSVLLSNLHIKLFSLFLAYAGWAILNQSHTDDRWIDVPVYFYETGKDIHVSAPQSVKLNVSGKRSDLRALDTASTAVHIDTRTLKEGKNTVALSERHVMIPETIKVTGWAPSHMEIETKTKS